MVSFQLNVIAGNTAATAQTNYAINPLSTTQLSDPRFFPTGIQDAILDAEAALIEAICFTASNPERAAFAELTATVSSGALLPLVGASGNQIIGGIGAVIDGTSSIVCSQRELSLVRMVAANENSMFTAAQYVYALDGSRIYHSRTNVKIDVATFVRGSFSGNIKVQDHHAEALVDGSLGMLMAKEEGYMTAAQYHSGRFASYCGMLMGQTVTASAVTGQ